MTTILYPITLVFFIHIVVYDGKQIADETLHKASLIHKRSVKALRKAYDNNFDSCMFNYWPKTTPVLQSSPTSSCCSSNHVRLCYGDGRKSTRAQFISCYNTKTLIPEFTAHIVAHLPKGSTAVSGRGSGKFRMDTGKFAPNPQAKVRDYSSDAQGKFGWSAAKNFFCSRGHLTPSGAFNTIVERERTFIVTNTAPQWQSFNGANWAAVENAVKKYADTNQSEVYVFTGTAGNPSYWTYGWWCIPIRKEPYKVGRVSVPDYFWKAVCDPLEKQSIVFVAKNNINEGSLDKETMNTCFGKPMTKKKGVIECYSLDQANAKYGPRKGFLFPDFDPTSCTTNREGDFLKSYLKFT